ncbi:class I SAM-dependent methyltransferase [Patescibacteria group bacterium]|nr:class I SAM-dependent methyltransferase [Patescibacteria group bacterium]
MNKEKLNQLRRYYDSKALDYDKTYSSFICKAEDVIISKILKPIATGKVLDIGSGNGLLCEMLDIDNYTGIELSHEMVNLSNKKYPKKRFITGDMHNLPFKCNTFDSVVSLYGPLSYSLSPKKLITEIIRVVKPNGYIALMPYTKRVQYKLEIIDDSTALNKEIKKIFYTSAMLKKLLSPLESISVVGINYFLNTYNRFSTVIDTRRNLSLKQLIHFLEKETSFCNTIPAEFARHMIGIGEKRT